MAVFLILVHYHEVFTLDCLIVISVKNNDNKCFLWCHIRHLNPLNMHPERRTKAVKKTVNDMIFIMKALNVLFLEKIRRLNKKIISALMYFVMKMILFILFIYQIKNLKTDGFTVDNR